MTFKSPLVFSVLGFATLIAVSLSACDSSGKVSLPETLKVMTRNAPTTWYQGREEQHLGPEHDLIQSFSRFSGIKVEIVEGETIGEILKAIQQNEVDLAAAGLTITDQRQKEGLRFGPAYATVQQQLICRRNAGGIPKTLDDLDDKTIQVIADSSYAERLHELKVEHPGLRWQEVNDKDTEQLLEMVWEKEIDCTVADSNIVSINRRYFPELVVAFPLSEEQSLGWLLGKQADELEPRLEAWLETIEENGELAQILERYYGHVELFDYVDLSKFYQRIKTRLPKYLPWFEKYATENNLDWTLLAAQAYQESHWNATAKSPTGVRGIMMLTLNTAKSVGVTSRLDPEQSIRGGAVYLNKMLKRIPETVQDVDRIWYALAAYNIGFGHLKDAMILAEREGKDPNRWVDLKTILPLLARKQYYKTLKYGYARGSEPVKYVQSIREYQQALHSVH